MSSLLSRPVRALPWLQKRGGAGLLRSPSCGSRVQSTPSPGPQPLRGSPQGARTVSTPGGWCHSPLLRAVGWSSTEPPPCAPRTEHPPRSPRRPNTGTVLQYTAMYYCCSSSTHRPLHCSSAKAPTPRAPRPRSVSPKATAHTRRMFNTRRVRSAMGCITLYPLH